MKDNRGHRFGRSSQRTRQGLLSLAKTLPLIFKTYGPRPLVDVRRFKALLRLRFMPEEAFQLGLFDPAITQDNLTAYLSKSALKHVQERLNPSSWASTVEDKALFYRLCRALGIASPALYAVIYRSLPGWTMDGDAPHRGTDWADFLRKRLPSSFVLKPGWGVYGREVRVLTRVGNEFVDHAGDVLAPEGLVEKMFGDQADRGWVLQERLMNHEGLHRLSGSTALQTFRIITLTGSRGARILHSHLKIIVGDSAVDNNEHGLRGNLQARVDLQTGRLGPGMILRKDGRGFDRHESHPVTGQRIEGFSVPDWEQICAFSLKVAEQFVPLQTVGWDVALTPEGPSLIEGNAWYDPPPVAQGAGIADLVQALHNELKELL